MITIYLDLILLIIPGIYLLLIITNNILKKKSKQTNLKLKKDPIVISEDNHIKEKEFQLLDVSSDPICLCDFNYYDKEYDILSSFSDKILKLNKKKEITKYHLSLKKISEYDSEIFLYIQSLKGAIKYLHNACFNINNTIYRYDFILITNNKITLLDNIFNADINKKNKFTQYVEMLGCSVENIDYYTISTDFNSDNYYKKIINNIDYSKNIDIKLNRTSFLLSEFCEKINNTFNHYFDLFEITSDDFL